MRSRTFTVTTLDIQHWHPGWRAAAEASPAVGYHEWATEPLWAAMRDAARRYIAEHPDLFGVDEVD